MPVELGGVGDSANVEERDVSLVGAVGCRGCGRGRGLLLVIVFFLNLVAPEETELTVIPEVGPGVEVNG